MINNQYELVIETWFIIYFQLIGAQIWSCVCTTANDIIIDLILQNWLLHVATW